MNRSKRLLGGKALNEPQKQSKLGKYMVGDEIGKGGFGTVYTALNTDTGDVVAIKQLSLRKLDREQLDSIQVEVDLLRNLNHANIVKYVELVKTKDFMNIVLEFMEFGSLTQTVKKFGCFNESLTAVYISQVLQGLSYLHGQGVIHRDIKGANILVTKDGHVKLADFGVALISNKNGTNSICGTPYWMAPEIIEMERPTNVCDIWSVGCTIVELMTGKPPYFDLSPMTALFRIVQDDHPPFPQSMSPQLQEFLLDCFRKNPAFRKSADELLTHPWLQKSVGKMQGDGSTATSETDAKKKPHNREKSVNISALMSPKGTTSQKDRIPSKIQKLESKTQEEQDSDEQWANVMQNTIKISGNIMKQKQVVASGTSNNAEKLGMKGSNGKPMKRVSSVRKMVVKTDGARPVRLSALPPMTPTVPNGSNASSGGIKKSPLIDNLKNTSTSTNTTTPATTTATEEKEMPKSMKRGNSIRMGPVSRVSLSKPQSAQLSLAKFQEEGDDDDWGDMGIDIDDVDLDTAMANAVSGNTPSTIDNVSKVTTATNVATKTSASQIDIINSQIGDVPVARPSLDPNMWVEDDDDDFGDIDLDGFSGNRMEVVLQDRQLNEDGDAEMELQPETMPLLEDTEALFDEMDLEEDNSAEQELYAEQYEIGNLMGTLVPSSEAELLISSCERLTELFHKEEHKAFLVQHHGVIPIVNLLALSSVSEVVLSVLKLIITIIRNNSRLQETLALVGIVPLMSKFTEPEWSIDVQLAAMRFIHLLCHENLTTLQLFVASGSLKVLINALGIFESRKELATKVAEVHSLSLSCVEKVFDLSSISSSDACMLLHNVGFTKQTGLLLRRVFPALQRILLKKKTKNRNNKELQLQHQIMLDAGLLTDILLVFCQGNSIVKHTLNNPSLLVEWANAMNCKKDLLNKPDFTPLLVKLLKGVKLLSMEPALLPTLDTAGMIPPLIRILRLKMNSTDSNLIVPHCLQALFYLCRLNPQRQQKAAEHDLVPPLLALATVNGPMKQLALPILCELPLVSNKARSALYKGNGLPVFLGLLEDSYWQLPSINALATWLSHDVSHVEKELITKKGLSTILTLFDTVRLESLQGILTPLVDILSASSSVARVLGESQQFVEGLVRKLALPMANVRMSLLRVLRLLYESHRHPKDFVACYGLYELVQALASDNSMVLVMRIASNLLSTFEVSEIL
eukprot:TRINITY_DN2766_c1_g1_i1.p1 TRINITY_DN2766_c1_g1~~TRINITY_DN2766_c1_g1_i1.p1  ORF type:complete len:1198 (-),score=358.29 TRINITY_DN2766_c1_g1_i1:212-3805(-)